MLQLPHTLVYFGLLSIMPCSAFVSTVSVFCIPHIMRFMLSRTPVFYIFCFLDIQMATWSFRDALEELEVKGHFDESMLWSNVGLRLGDIHFAEIQTTIKNACGALQHVYTIC